MVKIMGSSKERVQSKISENMMSSKFRYLNEQLYKSPSGNAVELFKENPNLFDDVSASTNQVLLLILFQYHEGYRN